jgi:ribonuclease P protein component
VLKAKIGTQVNVNGSVTTKRLRFPKKARLLTQYEYKKVFASSQKIVSDVCIMLYCHSTLGFPRLGLIVAKKNIRDASRRNRFKRIVRESFRTAQHELTSFDLIIIAQKRANMVSNEEIRKGLTKCWEKLIGAPKKF